MRYKDAMGFSSVFLWQDSTGSMWAVDEYPLRWIRDTTNIVFSIHGSIGNVSLVCGHKLDQCHRCQTILFEATMPRLMV